MLKNKNIYISYWLLLITFLVALMIVIGGFTRLTDAGLSITKWDLISGIMPPLSLNDWEKSFSHYKQIPEFKILNSSMILEQFKIIFWWEYAHRLLGRLIGLFYLVPLFYFTIKRTFNKKSLTSFYIILFLILFQGFIGWYMVKSGLTINTDVSHYRLSIHLTLAFIIYVLLLWNYLKYIKKKASISRKALPKYLLLFFLICIFLQIAIGALVSGLDAGQIYTSWPLMNGSYFPDDSNLKDLLSFNSLDIPSIVQFIHRNIAYLIFLFFLFILIKVFNNHDFIYLRKTILLVFFSLLLQIFLGILTVIFGAQILIASMHQIGSILLISTSLILFFKNSKIN